MLSRFSNRWITLNQKTAAMHQTINLMGHEIEKLQVKLLVPYGELQQVLLLQVSILSEESEHRVMEALYREWSTVVSISITPSSFEFIS